MAEEQQRAGCDVTITSLHPEQLSRRSGEKRRTSRKEGARVKIHRLVLRNNLSNTNMLFDISRLQILNLLLRRKAKSLLLLIKTATAYSRAPIFEKQHEYNNPDWKYSKIWTISCGLSASSIFFNISTICLKFWEVHNFVSFVTQENKTKFSLLFFDSGAIKSAGQFALVLFQFLGSVGSSFNCWWGESHPSRNGRCPWWS